MKWQPQSRRFFFIVLLGFVCLISLNSVHAQDYVTGAFKGEVLDSATNSPVADATVQIINKDTGVPSATRTDSQGRFSKGLLSPGDYIIRVSRQGYKTYEREQSLPPVRPTPVVPVPVRLTPEAVAAVATATPAPTESPTPVTPSQPGPKDSAQATRTSEPPASAIAAEINTTDAQRGGGFNKDEVSTLPLGSTTLTRTFDELGLLLPGVALPPQTQGLVAGPGVGAGVGSAGQFAVNGLRSRSNNFTVDGSDNNDEDIGVRRQGFFALVPQPIESIQEFRMITLLAPAQYGRNFGAQVNAISKSGGNETHGAFFGFFNSSQLNARNFFDTTNGTSISPLFAGNSQRVLNCGNITLGSCLVGASSRQIRVQNQSGGEDSFTLGQGGLVLGGPLVPERSDRSGRSMFYFLSVEGQVLNASREVSFAVPTIAQRGFGNTGVTGVTVTVLPDINGIFPVGSPNRFFPTSTTGDAVFSFFPFPNNPSGIYGANTFTQTLPASAQGRVLSGKVDANFKTWERQQSFTARYNFTQDWREIPATGGAIFSSLRPRVRTQNFSTFLNSELSAPSATTPIYNQIRASYGRTRLNFEEVADRSFLIPSGFSFDNPEDSRFLLNAPLIGNFTLPDAFGDPNTGPVIFRTLGDTTEDELGPVGQVVIAGFSPIGVDVFNFPQRRVNNTYQLADTLTVNTAKHSFAFGTDIRRTELNSDLAINARPIITFGGGPQLTFSELSDQLTLGRFIPGVSLAAAGAPSGFRQTFNTAGNSSIGLRYYQWNFFGQDEWQIKRNLSLSFGLRYEYNTPPTEHNRAIESTFSSPSLNLLPGLPSFIDGRTDIFDSDRNNFGPRVGFAYSPRFGGNRATVIRAGYGLFYDQILGAVVSQSRNVFPTFITADFAGGGFGTELGDLFGFNPADLFVRPGTLNGADLRGVTLPQFVQLINLFSTGTTTLSGIAPTLPAKQLETPMAHHYAATVEQQLNDNMVLSAGYVGTQGRDLLRLTTPNLGPNAFIVPIFVDALSFTTDLIGFALPPGSRFNPTTGEITGGRPVGGLGAISLYQTIATSRYDALQVQVRGRYNLLGPTGFQANYTFSRSNDDASDVFDLAGAPALPQNSVTFAGERAPSNFDARHRVSYNFIADLSSWGNRGSVMHAIFDGLEIAGTGIFQTGQPFTVNSINDVNLDGNLTDRLNSTAGIVVTDDRAQPLRLTVDPSTLLAPVGQDGAVPRNSFRAGSLWLNNAAVIKSFSLAEQTRLVFRTEVFNLFNRANYGIPVRFLEAPGFGKATDTITPARRIQFGLKLIF
ncbi:MAG TPA: carboxypeptidase regulatory-like domain-containing protein [Pyrinomonadaceae bacterium]|nr:carboxypeptidase regulatory-like domain-containing protein [Pyrinomonadaceae bacterium]